MTSQRLSRRDVLTGVGGATLAGLLPPACDDDSSTVREEADAGDADAAALPDEIVADASAFGEWRLENDLPVFAYTADPDAFDPWERFVRPATRRHWVLVGNRAISLECANDGTVALFDESEGLRWLVASGEDGGTGVSLLEDGDTTWGSAFSMRPPGSLPERVFGPMSFGVRTSHQGLALDRTVACLDGELRWVLVRVRLSLAEDATERAVTHEEIWRLEPRFLSFLEAEAAREAATSAVTYAIRAAENGIDATESFPDGVRGLLGSPAVLRLEALGDTTATPSPVDGDPATLRLRTEISLAPGEVRELWFRFGRPEGDAPADPASALDTSTRALHQRLPDAFARRAPEALLEIPWHAALLTGGACADRRLGGHTLNQGSTYAYVMGFNGAVRDPLQHALPLVYCEPDLALSVLRNCVAWGSPDGDLPYGLGGDKDPVPEGIFRPSDSNLWTLWLAAEYAAATGDLAAFDHEVPLHPRHAAPPAPLRDRLARQFRFFVDVVGRGARNHVRILNADWNDFAIDASGAEPADMIEHGSSVLNSAMASWVLGIYAGLAERLGQPELASEALALGGELRDLVRSAYNGRWFHRAYAPDGTPVGDAECWLEVQPWAILCGAASDDEARSLLALIRDGHSAGSPLGARVIWPVTSRTGPAGEGIDGGVWYSINATLVWAAARHDTDFAWAEWRKMTLLAHAKSYPDVWEGTLSGPDAYNAPESARAGRTWQTDAFAMQAYPVNNMHAHSQPLLAYLRLLGVEPTERGTLRTGGGGMFRSRTFLLEENGAGRLTASGAVTVETRSGSVRGAGEVRWG